MDEQRNKLSKAHQVVIDALGRGTSLYGLPSAIGRTYGLLFLAGTPMSVTEIADRLGITKGTASVNLGLLQRLRMVRQVWQPGRRGKFYVAERNLGRAMGELLKTTAATELEVVSSALAQSDRLLAEASTGPDPTIRERAVSDRAKVQALHEYYRRSYQLLQELAETLAGLQIADRDH